MKKSTGLNGRLKSFGHAFSGLLYFFKRETNAKIHEAAGLLAILFGFFFYIDKFEWFMVLSAISLVLVTEIVNTSIEVLVDLVSPEFNEMAGRVKDLAAASVLFASGFALVIGLVVFLMPLLSALAALL